MASRRNSESTIVYPEPLLEESDMCLNRYETYTKDEKENQYVLQNNRFKNITLCSQFPMN